MSVLERRKKDENTANAAYKYFITVYANSLCQIFLELFAIEINFIGFKTEFINCIDSVINVKTKLLFQDFKIYYFEPPKGGVTPRMFLLRLSTYFTTNFLECLGTFPVRNSLFGNEFRINVYILLKLLQKCYS